MHCEWNGETIHYVDEGSGAAVVLLHGLGGNARNWPLQRRHLSATHRVLSIDLPGHGLSSGRAIRLSAYPEAVDDMLDHAGVDRATLRGLSKGARTASTTRPISAIWSRPCRRTETSLSTPTRTARSSCSAGIGIIPFVTMLDSLLVNDGRTRHNAPIWFVHGTRNSATHAFGRYLCEAASKRDSSADLL
jgi:hypothetical protein